MSQPSEEKTKELDALLGASSDEEDKGANATSNELDDLLGGSSDAESEEREPANITREYQNEVDDLLGDSLDGHGREQQTVENTSNGAAEPDQGAIAEQDDLAFLGKAESNRKGGMDTKQTTSSKFNLPETFRIDDGVQAYFMRAPNFIKLQREVFDEDIHDESAGNMSRASAVIRWRLKRGPDGNVCMSSDGKPEIESNARFVKWSDGSLQLVIGESVFDSRVLPTENW